MIRILRIGSVAAAGALAAGLALAPANADELSTLRANNELLQQRLDQLAQVGLQHPNLPPGTPSIAGSFPRSFLIPGTNTSIEIGGFVDLHASYFFQGGGQNSNAAVPPGTGVALAAGITLDHVGPTHADNSGAINLSKDWFRMSASESRLFVETRTPTAWGQALSHLEFDFYGCTAGGDFCTDLNRATNPDIPRLRLAYGTLGGFLAGQTWVPGNDLAAGAEIFDFFGTPGTWGFARAPQIGYKAPLAWIPGGTVGVYLVQPTAELATPGGAFESDCGALSQTGTNCYAPTVGENPLKDPLPDFAWVLNFQQPWGHFQLHGMVREEQVKDATFLDKSYIGYGGGFSGAVHPNWFGWSKDNLGFQAFAGVGMGHWSNWTGGSNGTTQSLASNFGGPGMYGSVGGPKDAASAALVSFTQVQQWGGAVNYQHWWTPTVRTNVAYGIGHQDLPVALLGGAKSPEYNTELQVLDANLIWSPVPFINTGVEYTWDHRFTVFHNSGDAHILSYVFRVRF